MSASSFLRPKLYSNLLSCRNAVKPPPNFPYFGLYRTEGEVVQEDELLVSQRKLNYHPGANVNYVFDRQIHLLKAGCDGTVMITREKVEVDEEDPKMQAQYGFRKFQDLFKLTYNIVPLKMSNRFKLVDEV